MKYVIIGNGVASIGAIEGIRRRDRDGSILVIGDEDCSTYGRPLISYVLAGKIDEGRLALRSDAFYAENGVEQKLGAKVVSLNPQAKTVATGTGEILSYDKLLLATGGAPATPPVVGLDGPGVLTFTKKRDVDALKKELRTGKRAAIIGAGLIALKAAEGLIGCGAEATLIVRSRIMRSYFDKGAGAILTAHLKEQGLAFKEGASPTEILRDGRGRVVGVRTDKGDVEADLVVSAAGVRPDTALARAAGAGIGAGVLVDDHLRTGLGDVYAAGDCAEGREMLTGESAVIPIWPNAYNQGFYAGRNMAGDDVSHPGTLSMNSISYFGLNTISVGLVNLDEGEPGVEIHIDANADKKNYRKLVFRGDRLVGCIRIGKPGDAGVYTGFIRFQLPLDEKGREELIRGEATPLAWPEAFLRAELRDGAAWVDGKPL